MSKYGIPQKKVHNWSNLVKTDIKIQKPKGKSKIETVKVEMKMKLTPSAISKIYPDILIQMMPFMGEESYLSFVSVNNRMEDMSLKNYTFLEFLKNFRPKEYERVIESEKYYKKVSPKYKYYEIHRELYPDYYEENEDDEKNTEYETKEYEFDDPYLSDEEFGSLEDDELTRRKYLKIRNI